MNRVAWLGWTCLCVVLGVWCMAWLLTMLPWTIDKSVGVWLFMIWFVLLPAVIVSPGLVAVIVTLFLYLDQQDGSRLDRPWRRRSAPAAPQEPVDPTLMFTVPVDGTSRAEPLSEPTESNNTAAQGQTESCAVPNLTT